MGRIPLKTSADVALMRESCRIVAEVLSVIQSAIRPGAVLRDLDAMAEEYIRSRGGIPAFKGYGHDPANLFPGTLCISVDDEVVHGIPDGRRLEEGQVVSVDVGVKKAGWFGDGARTFAVGRISDEKRRLLAVTEESLEKAKVYEDYRKLLDEEKPALFAPGAGGLVCITCKSARNPYGYEVTASALKLLRLFQAGEWEDISQVIADDVFLHETERLMQNYIRYILEREIKSASWLDTLEQNLTIT